MKEKNTVWIKIALFSLMAGGILTSAALVALQFDLKKLNTEHYTTQTYQITEAFQNIEIHIPEYNIRFLTSDSDDCTIVYHKQLHYGQHQRKYLFAKCIFHYYPSGKCQRKNSSEK